MRVVRRMLAMAMFPLATLAPGIASAQSDASPVQRFASAFRVKDWASVDALVVDGRTPLVQGDPARSVEIVLAHQFLAGVRDCVVSSVFEKGVRYQSSDGVELLCPSRQVGGDKCQIEAFGIDFERIGDSERIARLYHMTEYNSLDCPRREIRFPAPVPAPSKPKGNQS